MFKIYVISAILILSINAIDVDHNTFSNYKDVRIDHLHIEWLLNLDNKYINATAEYTLTALHPFLQEVHFDIYQMDILYAYQPQVGYVLRHEVESIADQSLIQGDRLKITLKDGYKSGSQFKLRVRYAVDERSRALSFMTALQTDDGSIASNLFFSLEAPYLFSQCEANNCRSMVPIQDTPSSKFTYSATILTLDPLINVFMSGNALPKTTLPLLHNYEAKIVNTFQFDLNIKIPAYLIAIVAGTVEESPTGQFTAVISEKTNLQKYTKELEQLDDYVASLVAYIGPYKWGHYKIVILPASFPFGGMENPLLTFANPTIIVGDKSGVSVAVHEIAHSWFGNTVTCNNWSNMWINEGFCVFLERKGLKSLYDMDFVKTNALTGNADYITNMQQFIAAGEPTYASLHPQTEGKNADDSFSTVPYEKGYQLLYYLESLIGELQFQQLLKDWLAKYEYKSADENDFYNFVMMFIKENKTPTEYNSIRTKIDQIYTNWVYGTGLPPIQQNFSNKAANDAEGLADDWIASLGAEVPEKVMAFNGFRSNQKQLFLQTLISSVKQVNLDMMSLLENEYNLSDSTDAELQYRWYVLGILTKYSKATTNMGKIEVFVGKVGRMKMVTPIYRVVELETGWTWFRQNENFYHPLARAAIFNILNSRNSMSEE